LGRPSRIGTIGSGGQGAEADRQGAHLDGGYLTRSQSRPD